jgi:uncharacterized protein YndB with AHSA1/START domain
MSQTNDHNAGELFRLRAEVTTAANPERVYRLVSDLPRSAEWSPECTGGSWIHGEPGQVGAVFRGENHRSEDVVAWAPVVRGAWRTESEVVVAKPPRSFQWAMRDSGGRPQASVWGFDIEPEPAGSRLIHHFRMGALTEGMRGIISGMDEEEKIKFFADWGAKIERDLAATVQRIKTLLDA